MEDPMSGDEDAEGRQCKGAQTSPVTAVTMVTPPSLHPAATCTTSLSQLEVVSNKEGNDERASQNEYGETSSTPVPVNKSNDTVNPVDGTNTAQAENVCERKDERQGDGLSNVVNQFLAQQPQRPSTSNVRFEEAQEEQKMVEETKDGKEEDQTANDIAMVTEMDLAEFGMDASWEEADMGSGENKKSFNFSQEPQLISQASSEFGHMEGNYLKGCKWSPDGLCIVTNSEDQTLRLFNLPQEVYGGTTGEDANATGADQARELESVLRFREGELIYDYCWYPQMSSYRPETCCLASSSRDHPIHLWDAFTGNLRATYKPLDPAEELVTPHSLCFSNNGRRLFCGFNKAIRIFRTDRPGTLCEVVSTKKKKVAGQTGIISCFAMAPELKLYAAGSYSRSVGLYSADNSNLMCLLEGQSGGVTHLLFSADRNRLYSGGRKDQEILCWDVRNPGRVLYSALREVSTHQRIYFDLDKEGRYLVSGNQNGSVTVWDTTQPPTPPLDNNSDPLLLPIAKYKAHSDCVNGISLHPHLPVMATASGQRVIRSPGNHLAGGSDGESGDDEGEEKMNLSNTHDRSLKIWSISQQTSSDR